MKVILRADVTNVGRQGDIKEVAPGFARNFLLPRKVAMEATPANMKLWEREKVKLEKVREQIIADAKALAEKIEQASFSVSVKVGDNGKLFGSVTSANFAKMLADAGFKVEKHDILLAAPIKETGSYAIDLRLHPEVIAKAKLSVLEDKSHSKIEAVEEKVEEVQAEQSAE